MTVDTGMCKDRETGVIWMYKGPCPGSDGNPPLETPVKVWPSSGGDIEEMTTREFNRRFIVTYRFDLRNVPDDLV